MKRYYELTHEELIALKNEQIERLIDFEIAHEGIMPVEKPEAPSLEKEGITRKITAYGIGILLFEKEEDAIKVREMSLLKSDYKYSIGYDYKWVKPLVDKAVTRETFYDQADVVRIQEVIEKNKRLQEKYEKQQKLYDNYMDQTGKIRNRVWSTCNDAARKENEISLALKTYMKYLDLADNNKETADKFFRGTYKERPELIETVLKRVKIKPVENIN